MKSYLPGNLEARFAEIIEELRTEIGKLEGKLGLAEKALAAKELIDKRIKGPNLTTGKVAKLLGVSDTTVRRWVQDGKLRCSGTVGKHRRFERAEIERFLIEENFNTPQSSAPAPP
jgi:excisionase family DNA binding protein